MRTRTRGGLFGTALASLCFLYGLCVWMLVSGSRRMPTGRSSEDRVRPPAGEEVHGPGLARTSRAEVIPETLRGSIDSPETALEQVATPSSTEPRSGEEYWSQLYETATCGQLIDARLRLQAELAELTEDYYERQFGLGNYEELHPEPDEEGRYELPSLGEALGSIRMLPSGEMQVVTLPRAGFEEAYAIPEHVKWLDGRIHEVGRALPGRE